MAAIQLTVEICRTWEKSGKNTFMKSCSALLASQTNGTFEEAALHRQLHTLCWHVVRGNLKVDAAVETLAELMDLHKNIISLLADVLSIIDIELTCSTNKTHHDSFINLICSVQGTVIPDAILRERLDMETMETASLISSKAQFQQKLVKVKTKLYYKQNKFNLLREESEGYSKLITELNQGNLSGNAEAIIKNIKSLIGVFYLDPNRVLDIMLESFELQPHLDSFFVSLIRSYAIDQTTVCHILGFKFHFYETTTVDHTPASLYRVTALLLKNDLVQLDDIYPHLAPTDNNMADHNKTALAEAKTYERKMNVVILSDKPEEKDGEVESKDDVNETNQKLGLVVALLEVGDWHNAKSIMDRLPPFFAAAYDQVATTFGSLIHSAIEPLYKRNTCLPDALARRRKRPPELCSGLVAAQSFSDLTKLVFPMLGYLGPHIYHDVPLLVKLIRLGRSFMVQRRDGLLTAEDDLTYYGFLTVLDEVLLPSLSLLPCNCCLSEELWSLLTLLPYEIRYRLYGHWKNETYSLHPKLIRVRADTLDRARYVLKRLSKENVKPSGRQLGKISHSNCGIVFDYVLTQIQRYDNFIIPVVDSLKYLTSLSNDMLAYCIIEALANPERERLKHDDTNISLWLQSLASFAGTICRKYQVEITGLLQYVANQLKAGKSFDLLILRELVQKMAGIEISEEITDDQLISMSGGEMLRQEGGYFAQVRNTKKSSTRLKESLMNKNLDVALCMLMAQQRDSVIYSEGVDRHIKLTGKLYDQCQDTLVQFGSFLSMQLSSEEFTSRLPHVDELIEKYHVPPDAAFFLSRSQYSHAIYVKYEELKARDKDRDSKSGSQKSSRFRAAFDHIITPIVDAVVPLFSLKVWNDISAKFYTIFWSLCDYDLAVPTAAYEKQIQHLKAQIAHTDETSETKKKKERERCGALCDRLNDEQKKQSDHVQRVRSYLDHDKESWFLSRASKNETITQFLQLCVFPRCCFTATDAMYCAKLIRLIHDLKTPNFSTLICCDRIFCEITHCLTSCTENEAHRYGRFLCACLDTVMCWHSSPSIYDKECAAYPGFVTVFRKCVSDVNSTANQLDYENYRHLVHKWHFRLTKAVVTGLESKNFTQIRNSIIILTKILPHYPRVVQFGQAVQRRIEKLVLEEKENRPDIYVLALGYSGQLKSKRSTWVHEAAFHFKDVKPKVDNSAVKKEPAMTRGDASSVEDKKESAIDKKDVNIMKEVKKEVKKEPKSIGAVETPSGKVLKEKDHPTDRKKEKAVRREKEVKGRLDEGTDEGETRSVDVTDRRTEKSHRSSKGHHRGDDDRASSMDGSSPTIQHVDPDDRETKRRKTETMSSKEATTSSSSKDKHTMSPPADRDREKKERKRDRSKEPADSESKKSKSEGWSNGVEDGDDEAARRSWSPERRMPKSGKSGKKDKDLAENKEKVKKAKKDKDRNKEEKTSHSATKKSRKSYGDDP